MLVIDSKSLCASYGLVLRQLRQEKKLSQETLALEAGVQRNFVSLIERGKNQPSISTLFKLADVLGIQPSEMIRLVELELKAHQDPN